jgi:hypothetical protein
MNITDKEILLISKLLELAGDEFSNHTCNDVPDDWFKDWTKEEKMKLDKEVISELCGEDEYTTGEDPYFRDDMLFQYFSEKLKNIMPG